MTTNPARPGVALPGPAPGPAWAAQAACARHPDPDLWFPEPGDDDRHDQAAAVCAACPVRVSCLDYALSVPGLPGIWAGTTPTMRTRLRNSAPKPVRPRPHAA